jgi:hypothetical protein
MATKWMRVLVTLVTVVLLFGVAGPAAAQDVKYNALPDTDFAKFKSYKWVKIEGAASPDSITDQQIRSSIDKQLAAKGLTKTEDDKADLYVGYQVAVKQEKEWNTYNMGGGYGYGPGWGYAGGMGTATSTTIHIGTVGIDMYDPTAKQLVWRGAASKTLDAKADPEKRQKNLDKAMTKLLKNYPPPVKKK